MAKAKKRQTKDQKQQSEEYESRVKGPSIDPKPAELEVQTENAELEREQVAKAAKKKR